MPEIGPLPPCLSREEIDRRALQSEYFAPAEPRLVKDEPDRATVYPGVDDAARLCQIQSNRWASGTCGELAAPGLLYIGETWVSVCRHHQSMPIAERVTLRRAAP